MENFMMIRKISDYIENNLEQRLTLDDIAVVAGYSKFHLNRLFSEQVGCTIHKHIQNRRLAVAAEKLLSTEEPVAAIALDANYGTQQSFSYAFKQQYGHSPQAYRTLAVKVPKGSGLQRKSGKISSCRITVSSGRMAA